MPKISDPTKLTTETLVAQALALKAQIAERDAELKLLAAALIARGEGKHSDADGNTITVVAASEPGEKYLHLDEEKAVEVREICGTNFKSLFTKEVTYKPESGFADRADALLSHREKARLFALVVEETPGKKAYLIYPRK